MKPELATFLQESRTRLDAALQANLPCSHEPEAESLNQAIRYAVFPGGKRIRPLFCLVTAHVCGGSQEDALAPACAVEYLHSCSLVFDDLPSMDDTPERRGLPALHREFGESTAILAGLALLNQAYGLMGRTARRPHGNDIAIRLIQETTDCVGLEGMVGGQMLDLVSRNPQVRIPSAACCRKTTALMRLMLSAGAIVAGASPSLTASFSQFGEYMGTAYQMVDDFLDGDALRESNSRSAKNTTVRRCRDDDKEPRTINCRRRAQQCLKQGLEAIRSRADEVDTTWLEQLADAVFQEILSPLDGDFEAHRPSARR